MTCLAVSEGILRLLPQLALKFHWDKTWFYFELLLTLSTYKLHWNYSISRSVMPKPVFLMTVQAHKEYNSLTDEIWVKYEQLDLGEFGSPGTPAFDAEACELANLLAHVNQLCTKLNLTDSKGIIQAHILQALKTLFGSKLHWAGSLLRVWRMQFCCRYVRITGLLGTLCILPAITLVVWQVQES